MSVPLMLRSGPRPHGSVTGPVPPDVSGRTPGTATSVICTGGCAGVKVRVRLEVRIGAKVTVAEPAAPGRPTTPVRTWSPDPVIRTGSGLVTPGGRVIVTVPTGRLPRQRIVSVGWGSAAPEIHAVSGLLSNAE